MFACVPVGHSEELYDSIKMVLEKLFYSVHNWVICVDFTMVNFLLAEQSGYTKYPCFFCYSRATDQHWMKKQWLVCEQLIQGDRNIINKPLFSLICIILPPHQVGIDETIHESFRQSQSLFCLSKQRLSWA